jgi:hypothetical protein
LTDTTAVITTITEKAVISEARATALMAVVPKTIIIAEFVALGITEDSTREGFLICGALIRDFARASAVWIFPAEVDVNCVRDDGSVDVRCAAHDVSESGKPCRGARCEHRFVLFQNFLVLLNLALELVLVRRNVYRRRLRRTFIECRLRYRVDKIVRVKIVRVFGEQVLLEQLDSQKRRVPSSLCGHEHSTFAFWFWMHAEK